MSFQNQRNILAPLAEGLQRAGQAVGNFFMQKAQQQFQEGVTAKTQAAAKREEAMRALATGVANPEQRVALQERIRALEAVEQAPTPEAAAMWQALPNTHPIVSTILQRAARTEKGQPSGAIGVQGGPQDGQRPERVGGVTQAPATRTTATPFSGIVADVLGRANLMANAPTATDPKRHPYLDTVYQALDTLEERGEGAPTRTEKQALAARLVENAPAEVRAEVAALVEPIAAVSDPKPISTVSPEAYTNSILNTVVEGRANSFADIDLPVNVRARKAAAALALAPNDEVRDAMREAISTSSEIPMDELTAAERARDLALARTELVTGPQMLKAELEREQVGLEADQLGIKETTARIENLQLSMDDTRAAMQQRAETHEQLLRSRDTTEEEVRQGMNAKALEIFNESGIVIDKKYEDFLVESIPGVENKAQLRELGQERFNRYEEMAKLELRAEQLGVDLQQQSLTNEGLEEQLLILDVATNSFEQVTDAQEFLDTAVNSGSMGLPYIDRLLMNVRAEASGRALPFPSLAHVSEQYSEEQLVEARAIAEEVEISDDLEREAANQKAITQYETSRSDAIDTLARMYAPDELTAIFTPGSPSYDLTLDRLFTPAEKRTVMNRSKVEAAIFTASDPGVQQGMDALQLLADSKYPMGDIQTTGRDAIMAALDQANITDPEIRQGYITAITMGWHTKNVFDSLEIDDMQGESASELRLRLGQAFEDTVGLMRAGGCFSEINIMNLTISAPEVELATDQCKMYYQTAQTLQESMLLLTETDQPPIGAPGETPPPQQAPGENASSGSMGPGSTNTVPSPGAFTRAFQVWRSTNVPTMTDRSAKDIYMVQEYRRMVEAGADPARARDALIEAFGYPFAPEARATLQVPQNRPQEGQ